MTCQTTKKPTTLPPLEPEYLLRICLDLDTTRWWTWMTRYDRNSRLLLKQGHAFLMRCRTSPAHLILSYTSCASSSLLTYRSRATWDTLIFKKISNSTLPISTTHPTAAARVLRQPFLLLSRPQQGHPHRNDFFGPYPSIHSSSMSTQQLSCRDVGRRSILERISSTFLKVTPICTGRFGLRRL